MRRIAVRLLLALAKRIDPCALGHEWSVDHPGGVLDMDSHCVWCGVYRWTPGHTNRRESGMFDRPITVREMDGRQSESEEDAS